MSEIKNHLQMDYSTILASAIHDMKNSLSMLLNSLDNMIDDQEYDQKNNNPNSKKGHNFSQMKYEGQRVNSNLLQLLALYRVQNEQYHVQIDNHIVIDFIEDTLAQHMSMFENRQIDLQVNCDFDLEWFFDQEMVTGVLTNVINNLYRYTKDKVSIEAIIEDDYLVIRVKDNGPGFPEDLQYSLADNQQGISFSSGSTGLGLYFAGVIAGIHHNKGRSGFIITNNEGIDGGGCFSLYLP
jgi:signal transduction histidine kinase